MIKDGRGLTIQGDATGIPLDGARGTVGIRITIGDHRSCARFTGATVTKDVAGAFQGKNAVANGGRGPNVRQRAFRQPAGAKTPLEFPIS